MFTPDANESPYDPSTYTAIPSTQPKSISHSGTRMPSPPPQSGNPSGPPSPTHSRIAAAIAGVPYVPSEAEGEGKNGFIYVPTLPTPRAEDIAPSLMTTGTLLATPRILAGNTSLDEPVADPQTPFRINAPSRREQTGLRLSAKASKSLREKAALFSGSSTCRRKRGDMLPPATPGGAATPKRVEGLTPAARALLQRSTKTGATPTRREFSMGGAGAAGATSGGRDLGKVKWTPSPVTRR
jgi:protein DGCR14